MAGVTKSDILAKIAADAGITKKQATAAYDSLLATIYKGAKSKDGVTIPGLGKLIKQKQKARMGFNPATQEKIKIKAKTVLKFRVAKAAKDAVLGATKAAPKKKKKTAKKKTSKKKKK